MQSKMSITPKLPPKRTPRPPPDPTLPLKIVGRELFCQDVARGVSVSRAYLNAGYRGGDRERWELRNAPQVVARINWLLQDRVKTDTQLRHRTEKQIDDLRTRVLRELERVAFADARDLVQWDRKAVLAEDGTVVGFRDELIPTPSHLLTVGQAAAVKSITTKSGALK